MIDLVSTDFGDALPLGFEIGERLEGTRQPPYVDRETMTPMYGEILQAALDEERGLIPIELTITARLPNAPLTDLEQFPISERTLGPLKVATLGRICHALVRRWLVENTIAKGDTPPEIYVEEIAVGERPPLELAPQFFPSAEPEPEYEFEVRYRDRETGQYVKAEKWHRSRRAIRANARKQGKTPKRGRFVRVRIRREIK